MLRLVKISILLFLVLILCLFYGFFIEPRTLKLRHVLLEAGTIETPLRIIILSDIHIGGFHVPASRIPLIVDIVNKHKPDIVLIPGDFINGHEKREVQSHAFNQEIIKGLSSLRNIEAKFGTYASIGNHDVWYDADFVAANLRANGIKVLSNEAHVIGNGLCIVGLADHDTQSEDLNAFLDCKGQTIIAMMHSPDSFKYLRSDTFLAVAGHTHGGQVNLPFIGRRVNAVSLGAEYSYGLLKFNGITAYVTAGIGTSILPARFRSPPEIVLIEVTPKNLLSGLQHS